jgi:C1A family cysteine protease
MRVKLIMALCCWSATPLQAEERNFGLVQPLGWQDEAEFVSFADDKIRIPNDFDWRRLIGNGLQNIRNQASCVSCWAFAVTAVVESLHILKHGYSPIDLAEQTLVSSCSSAGSCSGGYFNAFDYVRDIGLPDENDDPYRARDSKCNQGLTPKVKIKSWSYIGQRNRGPTIEEMKKAIYLYGPIAVDVNGNFGSYSDGIYSNCQRGGTNHMVVLEGWNDDEGYWIMRNSWGQNWGEDGYMRIKYTDGNGNKCNGIGSVAAYTVLAD